MTYHKMDPVIESQHLKDQRENASKEVSSAAADLKDLNKESLKGFSEYYDKILFYSAGAFSFTLALINVISTQDKIKVLTKLSFLFPNVYWLYMSWFCYLIVCTLIIMNKKLHAVYLGFIGMGYYTEKLKDLRKAEVAIVSFPQTHLFSISGEENSYERLSNEVERIGEKEKENKNSADFYYKWKMKIANLSEILALLATVLLLFFSIQVTQALLWS